MQGQPWLRSCSRGDRFLCSDENDCCAAQTVHVPRVNRRPATPYLQRARCALIAECNRTSATIIVSCRCAVLSNPHHSNNRERRAQSVPVLGVDCSAPSARVHAGTHARTPHLSRSNRAAVPCVAVQPNGVINAVQVVRRQCKPRLAVKSLAEYRVLGVRVHSASRHHGIIRKTCADLPLIILHQQRRLISKASQPCQPVREQADGR